MSRLVVGLWEEVEYRKSGLDIHGFGGLNEWSDMTSAEGDLRLKGKHSKDYLGLWGWIKKVFTWKKRIMLEVAGEADVFYAVGFYDSNLNLCKICTKTRQVGDGPFLMRVGPETIHYFVISEKKVQLYNRGCFYSSTRQPSELGNL